MALEVGSHRYPALNLGYLAVRTTALGATRPGPKSPKSAPLARLGALEQEAQLSQVPRASSFAPLIPPRR